MIPRPGTHQTASSAKSPRSARPSFRAKASKIFVTTPALRAADTPLLPAGDETVHMAPLRVREGGEADEAAHLVGVVVEDRGLQMLALRCRLAKLSPQPAHEAHGCLIGHAIRLSRFVQSFSSSSESAAARASSSERLYALRRFDRPSIQSTSPPSSPGSACSVERFDVGSAGGVRRGARRLS